MTLSERPTYQKHMSQSNKQTPITLQTQMKNERYLQKDKNKKNLSLSQSTIKDCLKQASQIERKCQKGLEPPERKFQKESKDGGMGKDSSTQNGFPLQGEFSYVYA